MLLWLSDHDRASAF